MSIENNYREIIATIGEGINRNGLIDTPKRAAKAIVFLTQGYQQNIGEVVNGALLICMPDDYRYRKIWREKLH